MWALSGSSHQRQQWERRQPRRARAVQQQTTSKQSPTCRWMSLSFVPRCLQFAACLDVQMRHATCLRYRQVYERYAQSVMQLGNHEEGWQVSLVSGGFLFGPCAAAGKAAALLQQCCRRALNVAGAFLPLQVPKIKNKLPLPRVGTMDRVLSVE